MTDLFFWSILTDLGFSTIKINERILTNWIAAWLSELIYLFQYLNNKRMPIQGL